MRMNKQIFRQIKGKRDHHKHIFTKRYSKYSPWRQKRYNQNERPDIQKKERKKEIKSKERGKCIGKTKWTLST